MHVIITPRLGDAGLVAPEAATRINKGVRRAARPWRGFQGRSDISGP